MFCASENTSVLFWTKHHENNSILSYICIYMCICWFGLHFLTFQVQKAQYVYSFSTICLWTNIVLAFILHLSQWSSKSSLMNIWSKLVKYTHQQDGIGPPWAPISSHSMPAAHSPHPKMHSTPAARPRIVYMGFLMYLLQEKLAHSQAPSSIQACHCCAHPTQPQPPNAKNSYCNAFVLLLYYTHTPGWFTASICFMNVIKRLQLFCVGGKCCLCVLWKVYSSVRCCWVLTRGHRLSLMYKKHGELVHRKTALLITGLLSCFLPSEII